MDALPEDIEAMGSAIHQFWNDRVNECMRAGMLEEGDPEDVSITMWAHAHGLVQLYQQGRLNTDADGFRSLVKASSERLFAGVVTDEFKARMEEQKAGRAAEMASGVAAQLGI